MTNPIHRLIAILAVILLSGCGYIIPCNDTNEEAFLIPKCNYFPDRTPHATPEEACNAAHGKVVLKAGEFYRCDP